VGLRHWKFGFSLEFGCWILEFHPSLFASSRLCCSISGPELRSSARKQPTTIIVGIRTQEGAGGRLLSPRTGRKKTTFRPAQSANHPGVFTHYASRFHVTMSKNTGPNRTDHQPIRANSPATVSTFQKGRYALEELVFVSPLNCAIYANCCQPWLRAV
jgi:hypothetical protein